jgi:hypothetical protein
VRWWDHIARLCGRSRPQRKVSFLLSLLMKEYSVRSAYDLARIESFFSSPSATKLGGSSDLNIQVKHWKLIWAINCPNKMKIVIWRVVHNCLPTGQQLIHRHLPVEGNCVFCRRPKSVEHLFLFCPYTKAIWNLVKTVPVKLARGSFSKILYWIFDYLKRAT